MRMLFCAVALLCLGSSATAQDLTTAARQAEEVVRTRPSAAGWQRLGLARYLQNQFEPAAQAFAKAVQLDANLWPSHLFLGISRYRLNDFPAALAALQRADRLAPATAQGRDDLEYWLGATHIAQRAPLPGLAALERLLARNPGHAAALQLATETYAETASAVWNRIADESFTTSAGQEVHGYALESEGNRAAALAAFEESARLAPRRSGPGLAAARLQLQSGAVDAAAAAIARELKLDPISPEANLYAGLIAVSRGRMKEAIAPLEHAARWLHGDEEPLLALTQVYLALQRTNDAVGAARRALALNGRSMAAHELLLTALNAAGDSAGAAAERQRWQQ